MTDTKFGAWKPEGAAVAVDYSLVALEEIRLAVTDGFQKFSRGGIEVGGVLYGTYENRVTRILAVRPIACEHAIGPSFQLSTGDKALLREQLERDRDDERLSGFVPVGWYLSHTRGEINLTPVDVELFTDFFPEPWQVCMVLKPGRFGAMKAGFFVREADGSIVTEKSLQEFSLPDRMPGAGGRPLRERGDRRPLPYENLPVPQALTQEAEQPYGAVATGAPSYESPSYENAAYGQYDTSPSPYPPADAQKKNYSWIWVAGVVLAAALVAIIGLRFFGPQIKAEPIGLTVLDRDGQLQMQWSHTSRTVLDATSGVLEIVDGQDSRKVQLSSADLVKGNFTYAHRSGDVQVRLEVRDSRGTAVQDAARFLGAAPAAAAAPPKPDQNEADVMKLEHDSLQDEVTRLRTENAEQAQRIQQLERTIRIMQTRLNVTAPR